MANATESLHAQLRWLHEKFAAARTGWRDQSGSDFEADRYVPLEDASDQVTTAADQVMGVVDTALRSVRPP